MSFRRRNVVLVLVGMDAVTKRMECARQFLGWFLLAPVIVTAAVASLAQAVGSGETENASLAWQPSEADASYRLQRKKADWSLSSVIMAMPKF